MLLYFFKSIFERKPVLNIKALLLIFVLFSLGFSFIVPLLLIVLEGNTISEVITFLKSEPLLMSFGAIGGVVATVLIALIDWFSIKNK